MDPIQTMKVVEAITRPGETSHTAFETAYEKTKGMQDGIDKIEKFLNTYLENSSSVDKQTESLPKLSHEFTASDLLIKTKRKEETEKDVLKNIYTSTQSAIQEIDQGKELSSTANIFLRSMQFTHNISVAPLTVRNLKAFTPSPPPTAPITPLNIPPNEFEDW